MSSLDEVSMKIGSIEARLDNHADAHTEILDSLKEIQRCTAQLPSMQEDLSDCQDGVRDYRQMKYKGSGFVAGISAIFGGMAAHIKDLF